ncbi:Scavenger receptor class B member 1, partial [Goodea atripinnis]
NTIIDPKNDLSYTMWRDIPVPFFMSVYFFHVLNPQEILNGEKPMVEQRGPYVYRYKSPPPWYKHPTEPTVLRLCIFLSPRFVLQPAVAF